MCRKDSGCCKPVERPRPKLIKGGSGGGRMVKLKGPRGLKTLLSSMEIEKNEGREKKITNHHSLWSYKWFFGEKASGVHFKRKQNSCVSNKKVEKKSDAIALHAEKITQLKESSS